GQVASSGCASGCEGWKRGKATSEDVLGIQGFARVAQWPEQRFCKPRVVGSNPSASFPEAGPRGTTRTGAARRPTTAPGRWQSGQLHQTVNLASSEFGGSNPSLPTHQCKVRNEKFKMKDAHFGFHFAFFIWNFELVRGCSSTVEL